MNPAPSSQPSGTAISRPTPSHHSSRPSHPGTSANHLTEDMATMVSPGFVPTAQAFRPLPPFQSGYPFGPFSNETNGSGQPTHVVIKHLPAKDTKHYVKVLLMWSKEVADCQLLPPDPTQNTENGLRSALVQFNSMAAALEAKSKLDGAEPSVGDPRLSVDIISPRPFEGRADQVSSQMNNAPSSANSSLPTSRQPSRFNGGFHTGYEQLSPTSNQVFPAHELPDPDRSGRYQQLFSPQSPIGNHLSDRSIMSTSGKALINDDFASEEETSDLLKDVLAHAGNETPPIGGQHRRATAPYFPNAMAALSLNTTTRAPGPASASLPPYMSSSGAHTPVGPLSPNSRGPGPGFGMGSSNFPQQRSQFPPVNPADQNPPCNTLYVGNLPIDTSEEELKAMFSKQRGYKRLCFRTKGNGPMCFVEFEDISFATKALTELYGTPLHNSVKGGIRLSFSKNPLGVRSGQTSAPASGSMAAMNAMLPGMANAFTTASGPPPGLSAPPGLGAIRSNYNLSSPGPNGKSNGHNINHHSGYQAPAFMQGPSHRIWNSGGPSYGNGVLGEMDSSAHSSNGFPPHMMGR